MPDHSHLDRKYFVDPLTYNCPFLQPQARHVPIKAKQEFNWTDEKSAYALFAKCHSCDNVSLHLSFKNVPLDPNHWRNAFKIIETKGTEIDDYFFYSVPTSFFTLDSRIPRILRDLFTEAEGCLKSNFLVGGSACARKIIYELAVLQNASGTNYDERIKSLKAAIPHVDAIYFDTLLEIQRLTSDNVHENSNDSWNAKYLRLILAALAEILDEIYVVPQMRSERANSVRALREKITKEKTKTITDSVVLPSDENNVVVVENKPEEAT